MSQYLLSILIFLPLIGSILCLFISGRSHVFKFIALGISFVQLMAAIYLLLNFNVLKSGVTDIEGFQFVEHTPWFRIALGDWGILAADYLIGVDGLNVLLVVLSVVILFIGLISSWNIKERQKGYFSLYLLLNASIIGCFVALDFLLFYLFFELMLLPMYFLIGLWGGARREYASIKFFLYTLAGSLLILVVIIGLSLSSDVDGQHVFNLVQFTNPAIFNSSPYLSLTSSLELWGMPVRHLFFLLLFIGFAIKIPVVPLHTWLPDAHVEAPTPISVILAGLLLKTGAYGLLRTGILVFPDVLPDFAVILGAFGALSIVYAGMNALAQKDMKKMIAYSSVSHMGFVLVGFAAIGVEAYAGAIYQIISHGVLSPLLFILAGVLYDRTKDRQIYNYSGLAQKMPQYTMITALAFFAALGLPGFSGFIAEIMILLGAFKSSVANVNLPLWIPILATFGLLVSAAYFVWTLQRMFMGPLISKKVLAENLYDLNLQEKILGIFLISLSLFLGIFPSLVLRYINPDVTKAVSHILQHLNTGQ